jgi:dihydroxy-acid dehydratase
MVRISDARMSGTAYGTCVLHVSPESAAGGPLGLIADGDIISLNAPAGTLNVQLSEREWEERRRARPAEPNPPPRGYAALYVDHVLQADKGCDFDFLVGRSHDPASEPQGVFEGWVGGW